MNKTLLSISLFIVISSLSFQAASAKTSEFKITTDNFETIKNETIEATREEINTSKHSCESNENLFILIHELEEGKITPHNYKKHIKKALIYSYIHDNHPRFSAPYREICKKYAYSESHGISTIKHYSKHPLPFRFIYFFEKISPIVQEYGVEFKDF